MTSPTSPPRRPPAAQRDADRSSRTDASPTNRTEPVPPRRRLPLARLVGVIAGILALVVGGLLTAGSFAELGVEAMAGAPGDAGPAGELRQLLVGIVVAAAGVVLIVALRPRRRRSG